MARGEIPLTVTNSTGDVIATAGSSVTVNIRGGGLATIYAASTGGTTISNPTTIGASGRIDGWLDDGSYDIQISGTGITTYTQPLEIVNGAAINAFDGARLNAGTVAGTALAALGVTGAKIASQTITKDKLDPNVVPIGTIIQYWRPTNSHALPTGWLECNGASVIAANHDFTGGGTITVPDLRNKYILGADSTKAISAAATVNNLVTGAPGLSAGGDANAGGSNVRSIQHSHTVDSHTHSMSHNHTVAHQHVTTFPDHTHSNSVKGVDYSGSGPSAYAFNGTSNTNGVVGGAQSIPSSWDTPTTSDANFTPTAGIRTGTADVNTTNSQLSATQDWRPYSYGLIYLIKVKAT